MLDLKPEPLIFPVLWTFTNGSSVSQGLISSFNWNLDH